MSIRHSWPQRKEILKIKNLIILENLLKKSGLHQLILAQSLSCEHDHNALGLNTPPHPASPAFSLNHAIFFSSFSTAYPHRDEKDEHRNEQDEHKELDDNQKRKVVVKKTA